MVEVPGEEQRSQRLHEMVVVLAAAQSHPAGVMAAVQKGEHSPPAVELVEDRAVVQIHPADESAAALPEAHTPPVVAETVEVPMVEHNQFPGPDVRAVGRKAARIRLPIDHSAGAAASADTVIAVCSS